jgi:hypothetical protein
MKVADIEVSHHTDKSTPDRLRQIIARIRMYRWYRGGSRDSLDKGGGLNYGAEMTKKVLLRCKRINVFIVW